MQLIDVKTPVIDLKQVVQVVKATRGQEFYVEFTKADGSIRKMHCKVDTPQDYQDFIAVKDVKLNAYRRFKLSSLKLIHFNRDYKVEA